MRHLLTRPAMALAAAALAAGLISPPAAVAAPPYGPDTSYVALGDSYSSGVGTTGVGTSTACGRGPKAYPTLWAQAHGITDFTNATCGGAKATDLLATQIAALQPTTDVVTLTIGGNDVALGDQVSTCLLWGDSSCRTAVANAKAAFPTTLAAVDQAFAAINAAAPNAEVYVIGYPHLFETNALCWTPFVPSATSRSILKGAVNDLNTALSSKAAAAGFTYVDSTSTFAGHGVCGSSAWIHPPLSTGLLHPNDNGQKLGYLAALTAVTG